MPLFHLWCVMCCKPSLRQRWLCQRFDEGSVAEREMQEAVGCACKWCAPWLTLFYATAAMTLIWASYNVSGESTAEQTRIFLGLGTVLAVVCLLGIVQYAVWAILKGGRCIPSPEGQAKKQDDGPAASSNTAAAAAAAADCDAERGQPGGAAAEAEAEAGQAPRDDHSVVVVGGEVDAPATGAGAGGSATERPAAVKAAAVDNQTGSL